MLFDCCLTIMGLSQALQGPSCLATDTSLLAGPNSVLEAQTRLSASIMPQWSLR